MHLCNAFRDVFMEKHWKSVISRSVCDYFFEQQRKINNPEDIPPVITTPHHYLISIYRCNMFFVAVCTTEGWFFVGFRRHTLCYILNIDHYSSSTSIRHRIYASCRRNFRRIFLGMHRIDHQRKLRRCL